MYFAFVGVTLGESGKSYDGNLRKTRAKEIQKSFAELSFTIFFATYFFVVVHLNSRLFKFDLLAGVYGV